MSEPGFSGFTDFQDFSHHILFKKEPKGASKVLDKGNPGECYIAFIPGECQKAFIPLIS